MRLWQATELNCTTNQADAARRGRGDKQSFIKIKRKLKAARVARDARLTLYSLPSLLFTRRKFRMACVRPEPERSSTSRPRGHVRRGHAACKAYGSYVLKKGKKPYALQAPVSCLLLMSACQVTLRTLWSFARCSHSDPAAHSSVLLKAHDTRCGMLT